MSAHEGGADQASRVERAYHFLRLHQGPEPLLLPNPWDAGSARLFASMGFAALATTSSGYAASLGRPDGTLTRDEALDHARTLVRATDLPVSADLENCFADDPDGVAETVTLAWAAGLAGCSVEDHTGRDDDPIYDLALARDRVRAAAEAAHGEGRNLVLTARAENHLHGRDDLADTITRLQAFQEAGADVLYAPGLTDIAEIRTVVAAVDLPVNVLAMSGSPTVAALAGAGVRRISIGGSFAFAAYGAAAQAARELLDHGTYGYKVLAAQGQSAMDSAYRVAGRDAG